MFVKGKLWPAVGALAAALALLAGSLYVTSSGRSNGTAIAFEGASGTCPASDFAARIEGLNVGEVAAFEPLATPVDLNALAFEDREGAPVTIADFAGRTVLLNLWATWCAPCRKEMPELEALRDAMGGADFEVVALSIDAGTAEKPRRFYEETGLTSLPFYHDGTMKSFVTLKKADLAPGLPTTMLIDAKGCARGVLKGAADWSSADARALVEAAKG